MTDTRLMRADERLDEKVIDEMERAGLRYAQWPPYIVLNEPAAPCSFPLAAIGPFQYAAVAGRVFKLDE